MPHPDFVDALSHGMLFQSGARLRLPMRWLAVCQAGLGIYEGMQATRFGPAIAQPCHREIRPSRLWRVQLRQCGSREAAEGHSPSMMAGRGSLDWLSALLQCSQYDVYAYSKFYELII